MGLFDLVLKYNPLNLITNPIGYMANLASDVTKVVSESSKQSTSQAFGPGGGFGGGGVGGESKDTGRAGFTPPTPAPTPKPTPAPTPKPTPTPTPAPEPQVTLPTTRGTIIVVANPETDPEIELYYMPGRGYQTVDLTPDGRRRLSLSESAFSVPTGLIQVTLYRSGGQISRQVTVPVNGVVRVIFDTLTSPSVTPSAVTPPAPAFQGVGRRINFLVPARLIKGQAIQAVAKVYLTVSPAVFSDGEPAELVANGEIVAQSTTSNGDVSFDWTVPEGVPLTFKICLRIPKNEINPEYAESMACQVVSATRSFSGVAERKLSEMQEYQTAIDLLRGTRQEAVVPSIPDLPIPSVPEPPSLPVPDPTPYVPVPPALPVPPAPSVPEPLPVPEEPPEVPIPSEIRIPFISIDRSGVFQDPMVSVDGQYVGKPPLSVPMLPGKHTIKVEVKGFSTVYRTVTIGPDLHGAPVIVEDLVMR